ncbi:MAG: PAS domain S-box protein [Ignavibacteriales bacterium]|nr:MAG: PAS domain S-box protein [Ignavibacteriales bacterium]
MKTVRVKKNNLNILIVHSSGKKPGELIPLIKRNGISAISFSTPGNAIRTGLSIKPTVILFAINSKAESGIYKTAASILKKVNTNFIFILENHDPGFFAKVKSGFDAEVIYKPYSKIEFDSVLKSVIKKHDASNKIEKYENYFKLIESGLPGHLIMIDSKGKILTANESFYKMSGYKKADLLNRNFSKILAKESKNIFTEKILSVLNKKGRIENAELTIISSKEKPVEISLDAISIKHPELGDEVYRAQIRELTESKELYLRLNETITKYNELIELVRDGIFIARNGKIEYANKAVTELLGYSSKQLLRKRLSDVVSPPDYNMVYTNYKNRITGKPAPDKYDVRLIRKNKEGITVNLKVKVFQTEKELVVLGTIKDITQSKLTIEALEQSEQRFKTFYENTLIGIYRSAPDGSILMANPALVAMLGYVSFDEMAQNNLKEFGYAPTYSRQWFRKEMAKHGQIIGHEAQWMRVDGTYIWIRESAKAVYGNNRQILFYDGTVENITEKKVADHALQTSEKRFHSLFTNMAEGAALHHLIVDANDMPVNYVLVDINPEYEKIVGLKREQVTGRLATEVYNIDSPPFLKEFSSTVLTGVSFQFETYYEPLKKYLLISVAPWGDYGFATIFSDITQRKLSEEALRLSEDRYRAFVQQSTDGIWCFALEKPMQVNSEIEMQVEYILKYGYLMECNDVYANMFGSSSSAGIIGAPIKKLLKQTEKQKEGFIRQFIESGYRVSDYESLEFDSKGKLRHIINNLAGIITENKLTHVWGTRRDITDRKDFELELRKLSRAVEQSSSSIIITDTNGNIEYVNPKFCEVTGYSFAEVAGKNPRILKSDFKTAADYKQMWQTISSGNEWHGEFLNMKKTGELYWEQASISPIINDDGIITSYLAIKEDVTQRKRFEEELIRAKESAERADKLKSEFLAQMSHEIRTPLNNILTYIGLVREEFESKLPVGMESSFKIIDNSSKRLIRTIELILNLSEIQTGNFKVRKEIINLDKDVLENISLEFHSRARAKDIELVYEKRTNNGKIFGDAYSIGQIFNNLLENAIKYTNHGRIDVQLYEKGDSVCVEVKDTGIGISTEYLPNLFSPFTQEEMGYTRRFEGNGLGLSLVKKYVDINDATISVESEKHKGSTFRVSFKQHH